VHIFIIVRFELAGIATDSDPARDWYSRRIGRPKTDDEVYGYRVFVGGVLAGVIGVALSF
jgi:hypothetical protein